MTETDETALDGSNQDRTIDRAGPARPLWLPVTAAAGALGLTEKAVRIRIKRRTLEARRDDAGRLLVRVDGGPDPGPGSGPSQDRTKDTEPLSDHSDLISELRARLTDKDVEIGFLREQVRVRNEQLGRMQVLLQAEQQQVKALTDQRQQAPWWRRWFQR